MTKTHLKKIGLGIIGFVITISTLLCTIGTVFAASGIPEELLPIGTKGNFTDYGNVIDKSYSQEFSNYNKLSQSSYTDIMASIIKTILFLMGALVTIGLLVVGVMYLTGSASEENITKAKKILGYIALGIIIISTAYGVVTGILEINLFPTQ